MDSLRNYNILAPKGKSLAFTASLGGMQALAAAAFMVFSSPIIEVFSLNSNQGISI